MKVWLGIDPGLSGGIACIRKLDGSGGTVVDVQPMPMSGKDLDLTALADYISIMTRDAKAVAVIESVHAMPGQGVTSMFKFGFVTGAVHGIFATLKIPRYLVTPQGWKKAVLEFVSKDKQDAIDWCSRSYPSVSLLATKRSKKAHTGMSDALCIAHFCMLKHEL